MAQLEPIGVEAVVGNFDQFMDRLNRIDDRQQRLHKSFEGLADQMNVAGEKSAQASQKMGRMDGVLDDLIKKGAAMLSVNALKNFLEGSIQAAAALDAELANVEFSAAAANREFGASVGTMESWRDTVSRTADQYRMFTEQDIAAGTTRLIDMTKRLGFSEAQMQTLLSRTIDLSAGKVDLAGGIERVSAAMRGEAESAEYLGLSLNENSVKAYAEAQGLVWSKLTDLEKAQQRYALFLQQTAEMEGRAASQADNYATQQKVLNSSINEFRVGLGQTLIEVDKGIGLTKWLGEGLAVDAQNAKNAAAGWKTMFQALRDIPDIKTQLTEQSVALATNRRNVEELTAAIRDAPGTWDDVRRSLVANTTSYEEYGRLVREISEYTKGQYGPQLLLTKELYDDLRDSTKEAAWGANDVAAAMQNAGASLYPMAVSLEDNTRKIRDWRLAVWDAERVAKARNLVGIDTIKWEKDQKQAEADLTEAIEKHNKAVQDINDTYGNYILDLQEANQDAETSQRDYWAASSKITGDAAVDRQNAEAQLTEDLAQLAEERAEKLHWVETGGMAKGAEQTEKDYQYWSDIYTQKEQALRDAYAGEVAAINEGEQQKRSALDAARQEDLARAKEEMEKLKLTAALSVLETVGMLEQLTGGAAQTASDAAVLIRSGVIPVTDELAAALGAAQTGLDQQAADSTAVQASNLQFMEDLATKGGELAAKVMTPEQQAIYDAVMQKQSDLMGKSEEVATSQESVGRAGEEAFGKLDSAVATSKKNLENIVSGAPTVEKKFDDMVTAMEKSLTEKDWEALGEDTIVGGIVKGIEAGEPAADNAMAALVKSMLAAAKAAAESRSPSKLFRDEVGLSLAEGVLEGINSVSPIDIQDTWNEFIKTNLNAAYAIMPTLSEPSDKVSDMNKWWRFVENVGLKSIMARAWEDIASDVSLDTTMAQVYDQIFARAAQLAAASGSNAATLQAGLAHLRPVLEEQIASIANMTLAAYTGLDDERLKTMVDTASNLYSIGQSAATRWRSVAAGEAWQRLRTLEQERDLRSDTAEIDAQIAAQRTQIAETEAAILEMETAQQNMEYLQSQIDLLELMRDYNLDTSLLGGLQLGLNADPAAIIQATTLAMQAIVEQLSTSLAASTASVVPATTVSAPATQVTNSAAFGPFNVYSGMDMATLQSLFAQWAAGMMVS